MKPRVEKPNPHKRANQEAKAARYTLAIEDLAEASKLTALEVFGRIGPEQWVNLSLIIGRKPKRNGKPDIPSDECQLIILTLLREREKQGAAA